MDIETIRKLATQDRIAFKRHTLLRMHQRKILADEVKQALQTAQIIEKYPSDHPLPSCLILGYT
jgi:hypothetical protein